MGKMEVKASIMEQRVGEIDYRLSRSDQTKEKKIIMLEMDKADYYLRFQNAVEEKDENLADIMADLLAAATEETKERMIYDMDKIFRVQTRYGMRHKLPREVHIRFTKKAIRTEILKAVRDEPLKYK
uniref:L1 transposable element RRM domain-containing protein n=1 Tax=Micrurus carvalhoi TaxID=3147026 RepID=A0A2H6N9Y8_9SAUR